MPEARRKDSGCSGDLALLSINGRTSRISSLGSIGTGCSAASNVSAMHCSATPCISPASNRSRGSSPHRTAVETSFCGQKPIHSNSIDDKHTETILQHSCPSTIAKATSNYNHTNNQPLEVKQVKSQSVRKSRSMPARKRPTIENPKTQKFISLHDDEEDKPANAGHSTEDAPATQPQPKARKTLPGLDSRTQIFIPLRSDSIEEKMPPTSRKKDSNTFKSNPFSFKRMKPFTNSILLNFISKYDAFKDSPKETVPTPRQTMYEEFQKFISLRDDDDFSEGGGPRNAQQSKVDRMAAPVLRSRSLSDNMAGASIKDAELSRSDTKIKRPTSPTLLTNARQSSMRLSDSLLEHCDCDSSDVNLKQCHSKLTTTSSFSVSSTTERSYQSHSTPLDNRATRPAKSMTQLSGRTEYSSPSTNICPTSNAASDSECIDRHCSESAKEIQSADKMKSRSSSSKSRFRTFFKKNGDLKTEKGCTDDAVEIESDPSQIQKTRTSCAADSTVIIPLHSSDYDYEAAATASQMTSRDNDKKNGATSKTVAVVNPPCTEETQQPQLPPQQIVREALIHQILMADTSFNVETRLNTSEKLGSQAENTVHCYAPSPVTSIWVSFFFTRTTFCNILLYLLSII